VSTTDGGDGRAAQTAPIDNSHASGGAAVRPLPGLGPGLRPGQTQVQCGFALGWHMAELYGLPREPEPGGAPAAAAAALSGSSAGDGVPLSPSGQAALPYLRPPRWLDQGTLETLLRVQILSDLTKLPAIGHEEGSKLLDRIPEITDDAFPERVRQADERILELLTAADFRLEKAYSIGRALYPIAAQTSYEGLRRVGADGGLFVMVTGWLRDLKTEFAMCAADVVVGTLLQWQEAVLPGSACKSRASQRQAARGEIPPGTLQRQGEIWRSLLSGEKSATDYLNLGDYLVAGQHVVRQYMRLAASSFGPAGWIILMAVVVIFAAAIGVAISVRQGGAVIGIAGAALGFLGVTSASVWAVVRQALRLVQQPLREAEITDALMIATSTSELDGPNKREVIEENWRRPKDAELRRV
jgi:hypothetical protein